MKHRCAAWRVAAALTTILAVATAQPEAFVTRDRDTLRLGQSPFFFLGTNAYYLLEQAARGDTQAVKDLFRTAVSLNMTVVRTWGFFDSPDSTNPAVIQYRPGTYNVRALQALDFVLLQARLHNMRLVIPLVNNWDDYGGMNQYVRWRSEMGVPSDRPHRRYSNADLSVVIQGPGGRSYRYALNQQFGHDDFYTDSIIGYWYQSYIVALVNRVNTLTGVRYRDDPYVFGWELANEPRSSDRSGVLVQRWVERTATFLKSVDPNHLVGTGEEGFDVRADAYSTPFYNNQVWLFDGTAGVSFRQNIVTAPIDFASCHLYPESWNLPYSAGATWIRDHARLGRAAGKPVLVGEFGARTQRAAVYESWLNAVLYDGAAGALVWQILEGTRADREGYGFRCPGEEVTCERLGSAGERFIAKSSGVTQPPPVQLALRQNYPNPFNGVTTIPYLLPVEAHVNISVFTTTGEHVVTVVDAIQGPGERKELLDGLMLASGAYFYRMRATIPGTGAVYRSTRKLILLR